MPKPRHIPTAAATRRRAPSCPARERGNRRWSLAATLVLTALLAAACSESPTAPRFTNPFDPDAPGYDGNPLDLRSSYNRSTGAVTLLWNHPAGHGITAYAVRSGTDPEASLAFVDSVQRPASGSTVTFNHTSPERHAVNWYLVTGRTADGQRMLQSALVPVPVEVPPHLGLAGGGTQTGQRDVELVVETSRGDTLRIDRSAGFDSPDLLEREARPGERDTIPWDLGAAGERDTVRVYLQVIDAGVASPTVMRELVVNFTPTLAVAGAPATVARREVDLEVTTAGVARVRFALSEEGLADAVWEAPAPVRPGFALAPVLEPQTVHAEYETDFGFTEIATASVTPDDLAGAGFALAGLDEHGVLSDSLATVVSSAVATHMRFATRPDLLDAPWVAYADTHRVDVGTVAGTRVLYGQFRNDWTRSSTLTASFVQVGQPLEVLILAPAEGAVIPGGTALQVRGRARPALDGGALERVDVAIGDTGDWQAAAGTAEWAYLWNVPATVEDVAVDLHARAISAAAGDAPADTVLATISVTVSPPSSR
ncbi:MAG: hypothetical protein R6X25_02500 [Candidatus Krumholzibacteriia bacterium]